MNQTRKNILITIGSVIIPIIVLLSFPILNSIINTESNDSMLFKAEFKRSDGTPIVFEAYDTIQGRFLINEDETIFTATQITSFVWNNYHTFTFFEQSYSHDARYLYQTGFAAERNSTEIFAITFFQITAVSYYGTQYYFDVGYEIIIKHIQGEFTLIIASSDSMGKEYSINEPIDCISISANHPFMKFIEDYQ